MKYLLIALTIAATASAGEASAPQRKRLDRFNLLEYRADDGKVMPVRTVKEWRRRRAEILAGAQEVMGPLPGPAKRGPLEVRVEEENDFGSYIRQRISYQAEPGSRVPAFMFIPKAVYRGDGSIVRPGVLCLMGTGGYKYAGIEARSLNPHDGEKLAERGLVVIAPAYPILGFGVASGITLEYKPDLRALGYASGTMKAIWDNVRALDVLASLPYVKQSGFGVVGHSLGGHNAMCTALFEERLKVVVASAGFDSYLDHPEPMWQPGKGWSQEVYMPRILNYPRAEIPFDFHEVVAAIAPRALFVNAPMRDKWFPKWSSVARIIAAATPVYRLYGVPDLIHAEHPDLPHEFPAEMRERAFDWIEQFL